MKDKFAIFLDIDGTIYDGKEVKKEDLDAIKKARKEGHKVFINTVITYAIFPANIKKLSVDGIVAGLGTHIIYNGETLRSVVLPKPLLKKIAEYALLKGLKIELQGEVQDLYINGGDYCPERTITSPDDITEKFADYRIGKFVIFGQFSEEDRKFLSEDFDIFQYETYGEVAPKGYSKARGIAMIEGYLNISHENTIAIGDSANDLDMVEYAAIGVAMGNGEAELKRASDFVTAPVSEAGVAKAIEKFVFQGDGKNVR